MDSIEVARQRAEHLHLNAVAAGYDPCEPYAFVRAEAKRREIAVERVPKGDIRLFGGRALYDPDAFLILHEEAEDNFTNAFLVAHEIGHVEIEGNAEGDLTFAVDPLRSSEASPVGADRVADYSQRERRELQMDLFAREFLLPRTWVRSLHVDENATATAISSKLKAPLAVVAQQLLDALLLPRIEIAPPKENTAKSLAEDQDLAAQHLGTPFLLEAGPGTGKTQTLVGRIEFLLGRSVDPARILVLTFSNKAAGELSERISRKYPEAAASMWIGTFHGFGLDIVRRFHDRLNLPVNPRMIDRTDAIEFLEEEYPRLSLKHFKDLWDPARPLSEILAAISRANDEVVDAAGYRLLAEAMLKSASDEDREAAEKSLEVAAVFEIYERLKAEKGCVDFGDLVTMPVRLCESLSDVREHLSTRYEHILVDEFQDVNRSSVRLLKTLAGDGRNLWVVGDMKQSIYRFRGASSFNMARFDTEDFNGGSRSRLTTNYRSVQEIVDTFLKFASQMSSVKGADTALHPARGSGGHRPEYRSVDTVEQEIAAVAESIEQMRAAGYDYRSQAILSSGNDRLGKFAKGLEKLGIPVLYLGSLFGRDEIKDLLSLMSIIIDRRAMGLLRIAATDDCAVPLADVAYLLSYLKENDTPPLGWISLIDELKTISADGRKGLRRIADVLTGFDLSVNPWNFACCFLLDRSRTAADIAIATDVRARSRGVAIWQFMNFLRSQPSGKGLPIFRVLERIRRLMMLADERDLRQLPVAAQGIDAVRLMTMHGSKGLEFPVVHIPGLNEGSLPRSPKMVMSRSITPPDGLIDGATGKGADAVSSAIKEEQECLFFVALSRARDRMFFYSPTKKSNGAKHSRSSFVDKLTDRIKSSHLVPKLKIPSNDKDASISLTIDGRFEFSDRQLGLYERCPRRFLYTHILDVGGRRSETEFMRLHVAVRHAIDEIEIAPGKTISPEEIAESLNGAWETHGPVEHGYSEDYKRIARQLIQFYSETISGTHSLPIPELRFAVAGGEIVITPDQVLKNKSGDVVMRRIDTGHKQHEEEDKWAAAAFHIAANSHSPGCTVELVHLSDSKITPVEMSARVIGNRKDSIFKMGDLVRAGEFPLKEGQTCPRCPSFFICGKVPAGPLTKKFSK